MTPAGGPEFLAWDFSLVGAYGEACDTFGSVAASRAGLPPLHPAQGHGLDRRCCWALALLLGLFSDLALSPMLAVVILVSAVKLARHG
ncbi:hypothetical protein AQJ54_41425 [Streptomyces griseorubiginosus]|uniref:Uncharacterized protein n=1 Tax=Streptomyces griseorubiginosus TaxID=67304 RepID=A0A117QWV3_9ACTN|nr:hypothetical protein AQJ54_41425 [Streptomyces griseorubiginosus]